VLTNASGMPMLKPVLRNTGADPASAVGMALSRDKIMIGVNFEQIWGGARQT